MSDDVSNNPIPESSGVEAEANDAHDHDSFEEECVICLEELSRDDDGWGRCTPCQHAFHKQCWWKWENAHHERMDRMRRQGSDVDDRAGPRCCLCNSVVEQFVGGTGAPAHNPQPFVASDDGEDRTSFFDWLFRRRRNDENRRGPATRSDESEEAASALRAREVLERLAAEGGSIMGMDASVLLDQLRFGGDGGPNPFNIPGLRGRSSSNAYDANNFLSHLFHEWGPGGGSFGAGPQGSDDNDAHHVGSLNEIVPGTPIIVQNLVNSPRLNGQRGKVQFFQRQSGRYVVKLDANNATISLKGENILQIVTVKILGLISQPQFNERQGTICSYNKDRNRYVVRIAYLPSETKEISIHASNIRIPDGSKVRLEGLERQPQWNGRYGTIVRWEDGRYEVQLSNMYSVRVKVENVRL